MTVRQAEILEMTVTGLDCQCLSIEDRDTLFYLSRKPFNYCSCASLTDTVYWITPAGESALAEFKEKREQQSKDERQRRFQNQISVAQVLVPAVTFVLGLIVEFRTGIIGAILQLFR